MDSKCYVGIDPGSKGFISVQKDGVWEHVSLEDTDLLDVGKYIKKLKEENENIFAILEDVHAIFGASAKSTFNFGLNKGFLLGLLIGNRIPYAMVAPKEWQKEMWDNYDIEYEFKKVVRQGKEITRKEVKTKQTSINCCKRIFPDLDLRKTTRCKNIDDNKVDSILLSEYARRKNL